MQTVFAFLATLAILIVFHELGHYLVARWAGVKVLRFSVGFGQVVARREDRHGTEWALSAIPLGGYVKMLDEREAPVAEELLPQAFNRQSLGKRAAIVAAGPLANLLLAILLFWGLFMTGVPVLKPILGQPPAGTPAALAGIPAGVQVLSVEGEPVESFQDLHWLVLKHAVGQDSLRLETLDPANHLDYRTLDLAKRSEDFEQAPLQALGLQRYLPPLEPIIGEVTPDGEAKRAGLRPGDRVLSIQGQAISDWEQLVERVRTSAGQPLAFLVGRDGITLSLSLTPQPDRADGVTIGRIGAGPKVDQAALAALRDVARYGPLDALGRALDRTWELTVFSLEMMGRMILGQVSVKNLSGPITIADYAGQSAESGLEAFVAFLALVSISLGVLNLLPVPLLDGGHLLYYFAEFLTGRSVSERVQEIGQKIGILLLSLLMFLALYNDLQRLFVG